SAAPEIRTKIAIAVCALVLFDLLAVGSGSPLNAGTGNGVASSEGIRRLDQLLQSRPWTRMDTVNMPYDWQCRLPYWRFSSANGQKPMMLNDVIAYGGRYRSIGNRQFDDLTHPESPLLDLTGAHYIVSEQPEVAGFTAIHRSNVNIFYNERALPRFFLVG